MSWICRDFSDEKFTEIFMFKNYKFHFLSYDKRKGDRLHEEFFWFYSRLQFLKLALGLNRGMPK